MSRIDLPPLPAVLHGARIIETKSGNTGIAFTFNIVKPEAVKAVSDAIKRVVVELGIVYKDTPYKGAVKADEARVDTITEGIVIRSTWFSGSNVTPFITVKDGKIDFVPNEAHALCLQAAKDIGREVMVLFSIDARGKVAQISAEAKPGDGTGKVFVNVKAIKLMNSVVETGNVLDNTDGDAWGGEDDLFTPDHKAVSTVQQPDTDDGDGGGDPDAVDF